MVLPNSLTQFYFQHKVRCIYHYSAYIIVHLCVLDISDNPQLQQVECNGKFEFELGDSVKCHYCSIIQDNVCNMEENTISLELILTLPSTDTLGVSPSRSSTRITVDDSREPECCECSIKELLLVATLGAC